MGERTQKPWREGSAGNARWCPAFLTGFRRTLSTRRTDAISVAEVHPFSGASPGRTPRCPQEALFPADFCWTRPTQHVSAAEYLLFILSLWLAAHFINSLRENQDCGSHSSFSGREDTGSSMRKLIFPTDGHILLRLFVRLSCCQERFCTPLIAAL